MSSFIHLTIFNKMLILLEPTLLGICPILFLSQAFMTMSILMKSFFLEICPILFFLQVVFKKPILMEPLLWGYVQFHLHICQLWSSLNCSLSLFYFVPQEKEFHSRAGPTRLTFYPSKEPPSLHFNGCFNFYNWYIHLISWKNEIFRFHHTTHSPTIVTKV